MFFYTIKSSLVNEALYYGTFSSFRRCVEQAVADGISLRGASLRNTNLLNAELDGADFRQADLSGCNLAGANASECRMNGADFTGATLHGTILCESDLSHACMGSAAFGATDVFAAVLNDCHFSSLSAFTLDFIDASSMTGSCFVNPCGTVCPMSRPPVLIQGLNQRMIIMDRHIKIGHDVFALNSAQRPAALGRINPASLRLRLEQLAAFKTAPEMANLTFHKISE
ncbi:MAG: pentapeptide repeat-containing protein [Micavibrio sp.]